MEHTSEQLNTQGNSPAETSLRKFLKEFRKRAGELRIKPSANQQQTTTGPIGTRAIDSTEPMPPFWEKSEGHNVDHVKIANIGSGGIVDFAKTPQDTSDVSTTVGSEGSINNIDSDVDSSD